jgi:hypothetical protein
VHLSCGFCDVTFECVCFFPPFSHFLVIHCELSRSPPILALESPRTEIVEKSPGPATKKYFLFFPLNFIVKFIGRLIRLHRPNLGSSSAVSQDIHQRRFHVESRAPLHAQESQSEEDDDDEDDDDNDDGGGDEDEEDDDEEENDEQ